MVERGNLLDSDIETTWSMHRRAHDHIGAFTNDIEDLVLGRQMHTDSVLGRQTHTDVGPDSPLGGPGKSRCCRFRLRRSLSRVWHCGRSEGNERVREKIGIRPSNNNKSHLGYVVG